jgi:hypothetical protein
MEYRSLDWMVETMILRLGRHGEALFCGGELAETTDAMEQAFLQSGLLKPHTNTDCVPCPGCEEGCWVVPEWLTRYDGEQILRAFCDSREDICMVEVEPDHLRQWRADLETIGTIVRAQLPLSGRTEFIAPGRLYLAGQRRIRGKLTRFYVASDDQVLMDQQLADGPAAVVITPQRPSDLATWKRCGVRPVALRDVLYAEDGQVFWDMETVLGDEPTAASPPPVKSELGLPAGCTWEKVFISFIDDSTIEIKAPGVYDRRTFESLRMADSRRKFVEPNKLWCLLQLLADNEGSLSWRDFGAEPRVRANMTRLRNHLRELFCIEDDPIKDYRKQGRWETKFRITVQ